MNSESSLRYPSSFKNSKERKVELKGEGYFEVTKDAEKHFIVSTVHCSQVEVLGTSFNVEAYEESPEVSTTLIEGKVNFSFQEGVREKQVVLAPGQKVVYDSKKEQQVYLRLPVKRKLHGRTARLFSIILL